MQNDNLPESQSGEKLYTIGTVSSLTGVGAITLRAWERRYELIHPVRKDSGHRLYTRQHIDQINRITALTGEGMRISQIRPEMLNAQSGENDAAGGGHFEWSNYREQMIAAIIAFDESRLEEFYNEALSLYPIELVTRHVLMPLLVELGLRWETAQAGIAEEHFFAFYLRNKLGARFHHRFHSENGPLLLLSGLPGEHHEISLLLFALAANDRGFRLVPLGANMPLGELACVANRTHCNAIVLSGAIEPASDTLALDLPKLVSEVAIPVFVGGQASVLACDAINKTGAEALGQDMTHGLARLADRLK